MTLRTVNRQLFSIFFATIALSAAAAPAPLNPAQACQWLPLPEVLNSRFAQSFSKSEAEHEKNVQRFINGYYQQLGRDLINRQGETPYLDTLHGLLGSNHQCNFLFARALMQTANSYQFADTLWSWRLDADQSAADKMASSVQSDIKAPVNQ